MAQAAATQVRRQRERENGVGPGLVEHLAMSVRQLAQRNRSRSGRDEPNLCSTSAWRGAQDGPHLASCYQQHFTSSDVAWCTEEEEGTSLSVLKSAGWSVRSSRRPRGSRARGGRTMSAPTAAGSSSWNIHKGTWLWVKEAVLLPRVSEWVDGAPMALGTAE